MNAIIQTQLDRVEAALNILISSIESYNPSIPAALDLLAADTDLQKGVEQLAQHQAHHARILRLRSLLETHDQQRKSTLATLAETRKDVLSTPATIFPEPSRDVPHTELLDYARRISRYTVPPTSRDPLALSKPVTDGANATTDTAATVNGIADAVTEAREANAVANGEVTQGGKGGGVGEKSLEPADVQWLNPQAQIPFTPWPTEDVIKRGALGQIQLMLEQGVDLGAGEAAEKYANEGGGQAGGGHEQTDEGAGKAPIAAGEGRADGRVGGPRRGEVKPKVFKGLDLDEDSDDE
ncbi:MAG: hypothetical protein L6R39_000790 [Caloplaca ligustica]|nr:MAG: hypothetical protein L6R39_000790 [Caloplaca ligustica]